VRPDDSVERFGNISKEWRDPLNLSPSFERGLDIFAAVARRWRIIVGVVVLALACGVGFIWKEGKVYTAVAQIEIQPSDKRVVQFGSVVSDLGTDRSVIDGQIVLMRSQSLARRVIKEFGLFKSSETDGSSRSTQGIIIGITDLVRSLFREFGFFKSSESKGGSKSTEGMTNGIAGLAWRTINKFGLGETNGTSESAEGKTNVVTNENVVTDEVVERFLANLKVERVDLTYLVDISYQSRDAQQAAAIANAVGKAYIEQQSKARQDATRGANLWLQAQIDQLRDKVHSAEQAVLQYRLDHSVVQVGTVNLNELEISEYAKKVVDARTKLMQARARVQQIDLIGSDNIRLRGLDSVIDSKLVGELEKQYADLKSKEAELRARYGSTSSDVANVELQIVYIDKQIDDEVARIVTSERDSLDMAQKEEALLQSDFAKLKEQVAKQNLETAELGELERNLEITRSLYVSFLTRLTETSADESLPTERAIFISEAEVPSHSTRPGAMQILVFSGITGILLGTLFALLIHSRVTGSNPAQAVRIHNPTTEATRSA
jgi:uncharacterized protein involved in exopolysaccharide biosynthesis